MAYYSCLSPGLLPLPGRLHPLGEHLLALVDRLPEVGEGLQEVAALSTDHGRVSSLFFRLQVERDVGRISLETVTQTSSIFTYYTSSKHSTEELPEKSLENSLSPSKEKNPMIEGSLKNLKAPEKFGNFLRVLMATLA